MHTWHWKHMVTNNDHCFYALFIYQISDRHHRGTRIYNSLCHRVPVYGSNVFGIGTGNGTGTVTDNYAWNACLSQLGVVAHSCNPATGKLELVDGLRSGVLLMAALCRSGVRTKPGVNMASSAEARLIRLSKEGRTGPGRKRSRQESPRSAVVG